MSPQVEPVHASNRSATFQPDARTRIENDHFCSALREAPSRKTSGDPCADDHHIRGKLIGAHGFSAQYPVAPPQNVGGLVNPSVVHASAPVYVATRGAPEAG